MPHLPDSALVPRGYRLTRPVHWLRSVWFRLLPAWRVFYPAIVWFDPATGSAPGPAGQILWPPGQASRSLDRLAAGHTFWWRNPRQAAPPALSELLESTASFGKNLPAVQRQSKCQKSVRLTNSTSAADRAPARLYSTNS